MNTSVEISYYPLKEEFIPAILSFIDRLKTYPEIHVEKNGISTHVFGKYSQVMKALTNEIEKSFEIPHSVFVLKIINADLRTYNSKNE